MSWFWFFWLLLVPLIVFFAIVRNSKNQSQRNPKNQFSQAARQKRRHRYQGNIVQSVQQPVVYTVAQPTPVYVQPVHNNFPNTRHVASSTLVVEQRLNQHYAGQVHQQAPPPYVTNQPQRY